MRNNNHLRQTIDSGLPITDFVDTIAQNELKDYLKNATEASLLAHTALIDGYRNGNTGLVTVYTDEASKPGKYLSFKDADGNHLFGPWNPDNPASDIGVRSANPDFSGVINPATVIHADLQAADDFKERGAPAEAIDVVAAVGKLNGYVEQNIAVPLLEDIARAYGIDPQEYVAHYVERGRRAQILTRSILYWHDANPLQRPVGVDGSPLLIKEHVDKSSWTINLLQTSESHQHFADRKWHDDGTAIAAFRGAADSYLPHKVPAVLHRAVVKEHEPTPDLVVAGIGRIAMPMFISPIHDDARIVASNSTETHPTQAY